MNTVRIRRTAIAAAVAAMLPFSLTACSESGSDTEAAPGPAGHTRAHVHPSRPAPGRLERVAAQLAAPSVLLALQPQARKAHQSNIATAVRA
ncbi:MULTISPECIES: hypothetical protein [Streptomyces]|uniref:Lipoprotein n=1 Tax=Streptomyces changanensis TaxID=2964669 RepID=A0ABY5NEV1_9ACTN|nr:MULTISPECIES: hypothetical protein [Streptomyces]UUS34556.1 hypothetical protein NRO40_29540 [Streptomyces changanensis]